LRHSVDEDLPAKPRLRQFTALYSDISRRAEISSRKSAVAGETSLKFEVNYGCLQ